MEFKIYIPARYVLVLFIFLTSMMMKCQRAMLNVAILAMVNHTAIYEIQNVTTSEECPVENMQNLTSNYQEGSYIWTQSAQGIILGSYFYGYVTAQLIGGTIIFLIGPKKIFILTSFVTSIFVLLTPISAEYGVIIISVVQTIIGLAQGLLYPAAYTILARWSPESEKTTFLSVSTSGNQIGAITGMIVTGYLCQYGFAGGWPSSFYVFGSYGVMLSFFLLLVIYERPQEHPRISDKELNFLNENVTNLASHETKLSVPWKNILTSKAIWATAFTKICWGFGFYVLVSKLPSYLKIVLHFPIQKNGLINAAIFSCDAVTVFVSGFIADFVRNRNFFSITTTRKILESIGTFGPGLFILSIPLLGCNSTKVIIFLSLAMGCFGFCVSGDAAIVFDMAPDFAGALYGLTSGLSSIPGFITPYVAGLILDKNQGDMVQWSYVFYMASAFYFFGGVLFLIGASAELQPWAISKSTSNKHKN